MSVETLISNAQSYSSTVLSNAVTALKGADDLVRSVGYSVPSYTAVTLPAPPPSSINLALPTLDTVTLDLPAEPGDILTFQDISPIVPGALPTLNASAPTITLPTEPSQMAGFTQVTPIINTSLVFPEPPAELLNPLITAPTLNDRAEPDAPQIMLPAFGAMAPVDTSTVPTDLAGSFDDAYRNAAPSTVSMVNGYVDAMMTKYNPRYTEQMAAIETQLATYMAGGTGLKPAVENAIYERARSKNDAETRRVRDANWADAAARGFTLPHGALMAGNQAARQAGADNNAAAAREIVVMQAELEQKNLQFAVTTSTGLRTMLLNASLSYMQNLTAINGQALDYAKSVLGSIIESYNTAVKAYSLKLDLYKTEAAVHETKLKSAMAGIELYKAEIDALQAMTQVDKSKVDVYRARIEALVSLSNVYKSQIDAVQGRASLEKLKLDLFQTQVQTYTAQVQGKNSEWQGYRAAIEGQTAKAQIFNTQVQAYGAQVQGYKAGIDAQSEVVRSQALTNEARAKQYSAVLSGYQTVVQARGEVAKIKIESQRAVINAFQAQTSYAVSNAHVAQEYYKSVSTVGIANAEFKLKAILGEIQSKNNFQGTIASLASHSASVYGNLASASLSGMNTLVSNILNQ